MIRHLVLFRHGEAETERGQGDHARQLTARGEKQAAATAKTLSQKIKGKTCFLVSDAARTLGTFAPCKALFSHAQSVEDGSLYLAGLDSIQKVAKKMNPGNDVENLVVVGHNPGLSTALATLSSDLSGLHTGDAAVLSIESDSWQEALSMAGCWDVDEIVRG